MTAYEKGSRRPEPIRFFGTTWVAHDGGYAWRRAAVAAGALLGAVLGVLVLRFAFQGLADARVSGLVRLLAAGGPAVGSVLAFHRTWQGFLHRGTDGAGAADGDRAGGGTGRGICAIGFVGVLTAYFVRTLTEAPGESLHRDEYEAAPEPPRATPPPPARREHS